jgi:protein tyrosine phosphatase (PTP) superfamily phosphohydrolase (DUF442 family)
MRRKATLLVLACCLAAGCVGASGRRPATSTAAPPKPPPSFFDRKLEVGKILVGGQPTREDLDAFKARGVTDIVNLRTTDEMKDVGFDEPALADRLGITYLSLPVEGSPSYTPALLEAFADRVEHAKGTVVLHCTVGGRAGQLYAAYAVKYLGKTPEEALSALKPLGGWPLALERLLGRPLTVEFAREAN